MTTKPHNHDHSHPHADVDDKTAQNKRIQRLAMFLEAHFGDVELHMPDPDEMEDPDEDQDPGLLVRFDEADAFINLVNLASTRLSQ